MIYLVAIILFTVFISYRGFNDSSVINKLIFNPYKVSHNKEYSRLFTHGFIHADWTHLLINMFVLFSFGNALMNNFAEFLTPYPTFLFMAMYFTALPFASLYSLSKRKNNMYYNSLGASGAVAAVVFANIFFEPWTMLYFFGIIPVPGILFGIGYLYYSYTMNKKANDNIGHDAHLFGAIYGLLFPVLIKPDSILIFISKLTFSNQ